MSLLIELTCWLVFKLAGKSWTDASDKARHRAYAANVWRHKWFVTVAGLALYVSPWRLIVHDWTKFTAQEWFSYAECFFDEEGGKQYKMNQAFDMGWNAHQKRHDHHWQYWVLLMDDGTKKLLPMSDQAQREMLADWRGAGMAYGNTDTAAWYRERRGTDRLQLAPKTQEWVEQQLGVEA